ncbi:hypothetical protein I553_2302 [Mycobacterium xenopi 4042]|uniref:Uncharacterized protein n=1 Tax=Mycobacterium xenopi 4042 TaxID=1299334 RepID=X7ZCX4_MYCXE|nr:hypothetical protein I553_2302 [Mycobacterium xenopi 4042]
MTRRAGAGVGAAVVCRAGARAPDAVALSCGGRSWSYRQLDEASNRWRTC